MPYRHLRAAGDPAAGTALRATAGSNPIQDDARSWSEPIRDTSPAGGADAGLRARGSNACLGGFDSICNKGGVTSIVLVPQRAADVAPDGGQHVICGSDLAGRKSSQDAPVQPAPHFH